MPSREVPCAQLRSRSILKKCSIAAHERILETLTTPGRVESGNEKPVALQDG
jgi:hypothetical protein